MQPTADIPDHTPEPLDPPRVSVRGPAALAAALPYLMDRPVEGRAVLAVVNGANQLRLAAHRALPQYPAGASPEVQQQWADDVGRLVVQGAEQVAMGPDEGMAVVLFLPDGLGQPSDWFVSRVVPEQVRSAPMMLDVIAVFQGRWRSLVCQDDTCCPPAGLVVMDNSDAVLVCAELVGAGLAAAPNRRPAVAIAPEQLAGLLGAMPYPTTVKARRALLRQAWPLVAAPLADLEPTDVAILLLATDRPGVRDALLTKMARAAAKDPAWWGPQLSLWEQVLAVSPPDWVPGPACMLAVAAWAFADEEDVMSAVALALDADPDHRMATLIRRLVRRGIPATDWFGRMAGIAEADCLKFDRPPGPRAGRGDHEVPRAAG